MHIQRRRPLDHHLHHNSLRLVVIEENGGRLYVWPKANRCCGRSRLLTSAQPSKRNDFARRDEVDEFALFMPVAIARLPEELHLELKRFPRRVEAYWDGRAWIV